MEDTVTKAPIMTKTRPLILLSGGVDSALMLEIANRNTIPSCLFVDYGQPSRLRELHAANSLVRHYRFGSLIEITVNGMRLGGMTGGLENNPMVVPGRNMTLVALAANLRPEEIWIGCNLDDQADYHDCRKAFLEAASRAIEIPVKAPLLGMSKETILDECKRLEVPVDLCWSCYLSKTFQCGICNSCKSNGVHEGE